MKKRRIRLYVLNNNEWACPGSAQSMVVAAQSEDSARSIAAKSDNEDLWHDNVKSECIDITDTTDEGVVLSHILTE